MVGMDNTAPINCQVSPAAEVWLAILSDNHVSKVWIIFEAVSVAILFVQAATRNSANT